VCEECLLNGEMSPISIVHHTIELTPENINNPEVALNFDNLRGLCLDCHNKTHYEESSYEHLYHNEIYEIQNRRDTRAGMRFDDNGQLIKAGIYIVYGPPASGKTTYIKEHMTYGDLVIDLDTIKQAISYCDKTSAPDNLWIVANAVRQYMYGIVERGEYDSDNVWIAAGLPIRKQREELAKRMKAELIYVPAKKEVCIARANKDETRKNKAMQEHIINKWFSLYEE
jgi:predicted kinase